MLHRWVNKKTPLVQNQWSFKYNSILESYNLIPTKSKLELLFKCVDSILTKTEYKNYEILIADTGSNPDELGEIRNDEDWFGRNWETNVGQISLKRLNGWFQMYFFPLNEEENHTKN